MRSVKRKAFAYITHQNRLLVFVHPEAPEAGIQVPAGTIRGEESPEDAVLREATEETGLSDLALVSFLGPQEWVRPDIHDEVHYRYFFHLRCVGSPPDSWRHYETDPSEGEDGPIPFDFFWVALPDGVPDLIADHGAMLPRLLDSVEAHASDR